MKRILLTVATIATSLLALNGCTKRSGGSPAITFPPTGDWKITYYYDAGDLVTSSYADYTFSFKDDNVVTTTVNGLTSAGYWALSAESQRQEFNIAFNTGDSRLSQINDDWDVKNVSDNEVLLTEDGNEIHFTRLQPSQGDR